jgi:hypothetical protein
MRHYAGSALMLIVTMAAAVGCYTINLRVSAERSAVEGLRNRLVADAREIRTLQAELRTRARFPEMQRWNDGVFQMSAPAAGQYLRSPVQLASYGAAPAARAPSNVLYAVTAPAPVAPTSPVVTVSYAPATPPEAARLIRAGYTAAPKPKSLAIDLDDIAAAQAETPIDAPAPAKPAAPATPRHAPASASDLVTQGAQ